MKHQAPIQYFDLIAKLINKLFSKNIDLFNDPSKRRTVREDPAWEQAADALIKQYPQLEDRQRIYMHGIERDTAKAVLDWTEQQEFFSVLALIRRLDRAMPWEDLLKLSDVHQKGTYTFTALNSNIQETGIVLSPRVPSFQDNRTPSVVEAVPVRKWQSYFDPGINQELKNIYCDLAETLVLRGLPCRVKFHVLDTLSFLSRKKLCIAMLPVTRNAGLRTELYSQTSGEETKNLFSLKGVENWEQVKSCIRAGWREACRQDADIAILPECMGHEELFALNEEFSEFFDELARESEAEGFAAPQLTIGPTWWHDHHNRLYVTDSSGGYVCIQEKQFPFEYLKNGQTYSEDIRPYMPEVHVLDVPGLGRIGFAVCADLLHAEMMDLLVRRLHINFIICSAWSPGTTLFSRICETGGSYGTTAIWMNACSAVSEPEKGVGIIAAPGQNIRLCPECGGNCGKDNAACLFITDLDLTTGEFSPPSHIYPSGEVSDT